MSSTLDSRILDSRRGVILLYLLVAALVHFPGLGATGLVGLEAMTAATAGRMLETGELLVPELYGEVYTYKPPLTYWLVAVSMWVFGSEEWAARLPGALLSLLAGLGVTLLVGGACRHRTGLVAGLATVTSFLWLQKARLGDFDVVLASFVGIAIAGAWYGLSVEKQRLPRSIWILSYLALAAGFLAKGTPALMAYAPGLLAAALFSRQTRRLRCRGHLAGLIVFAFIVGGYLTLLWNSAGASAFAQPLAEAQHRGLEWTLTSLGRTLLKPLFVFGAFLPWSLAWPWSLTAALRPPVAAPTIDRQSLAAWGFLGFGILTFMAVPTHETRYYLPLGVPAAIAAAIGLERIGAALRRAEGWFAGTVRAFGVAAVALAFAPIFAPARVPLLVTGLLVLIAASLGHRVAPRHRAAGLLLVAALCAWAVETAALRPHRGRYRVLASAGRALATTVPHEATVWAPGVADIVGKNGSLFHYLDRPVRTFRLTGALPAPGSWVLLTATEVRALEASRPARLTRLTLVRRVHDPWRLFLLYRVTGA